MLNRKSTTVSHSLVLHLINYGRKIYDHFFDVPYCDAHLPSLNDSNLLIAQTIKNESPALISRLGHFEAEAVFNHAGVVGGKRQLFSIIQKKSPLWWWDSALLKHLYTNVGLFPITESIVDDFCLRYEHDIPEIDVLGSWLKIEKNFENQLSKAKKFKLHDLEPFFADNPWTHALEGKTVLVVHPFSQSIEKQYAIKDKVFPNGLLPDFNLKVIPAVQSLSGQDKRFDNWFQAFDFMKNQIDSLEYDICIIGAGGYGLPLGAHVKRQGKIAIHLGGVTQMLFGIKGARWEQFTDPPYRNLFNDYWIKPSKSERPINADVVEHACYW